MPKDRFKVLWTDTAAGDLRRIVDRIADEGSPKAALLVLARMQRRTAALRSLPLSGRVVPELLEQGVDAYREIVIPPWRIVYKAAARVVSVLAVVDSRRNLEDLLLERFLDPAAGR
ncbi:MAG: type II toxin-antitoxin system RelE/ParE family toxin [Elusimicrobia bacterium]|nr:type II toxin-antitoxin system RelE/ParE family toxin [Elusimicrobiota bacterium]